MPIPTPPERPNVTRNAVELLLKRKGFDKLIKQGDVSLVSIRGYYLDSMGKKGKNDLNMFDDMACWLWPMGFAAFNFNVDPTRFGWNANAGKYMAQLCPGIWDFVMRKHKGQYDAFGQGDNPVAVYRRDSGGKVVEVEEGLFGINIHRSGVNSTSSEGCQTVPIPQWDTFKNLGYSLLKQSGQKRFKYVLFDEETERQVRLVS